MKITRDWIRDYLDTDLNAERLAEHLIRIGFDVEEIVPVGDDWVLTVDVPSNRPDALGVIGLARELAACLGRPMKMPSVELHEAGEPVSRAFRVEIRDVIGCPRYTARLLRGVHVAPSPDWMANRLAAIGLTPVNNVVDVTNYVLYECGQPLHAFDAGRLRGGQIQVRRGQSNESLQAINGKRCIATPDTLVIADTGGPIAFAGVMGGQPTEIGPETRDVLLESAQFDPVVIRRSARALGLASDSSYRFERGVSFDGVEWASRRAALLLSRVAGAVAAPGFIDEAPAGRPAARSVRFRPARCESLLGMSCNPAEVRRVLETIGCRWIERAAEPESVDVDLPEYRRDLLREIDLVEEVARHLGYDRIPTSPQIPLVVTGKDRVGRVEARVRERLVALGYQETLTLSFGSDETARAFRLEEIEPAIVLGKMGTPDRPLRQSMVASLLDVIRTNERYGEELPAIFEIATVYGRRADGSYVERPGLGMVFRGAFRDFRGHLESLGAALGLDLQFGDGPPPGPLWPAGRTALIRIGEARVGAAADVPAAVLRAWDLRKDACIAEIDMIPCVQGAILERPCREFSRMPEVRRDLAWVVDEAVTWDRIVRTVREAAPPWMQRVEAFDVFRGSQIPPGRKSVAFAMSFRRDDRTLTRQEVDEAITAIVRQLEKTIGGTLR